MSAPLKDFAYSLEHPRPANVEAEVYQVREGSRVTFAEFESDALRIEIDHREVVTMRQARAGGDAPQEVVDTVVALVNTAEQVVGEGPRARSVGGALIELSDEECHGVSVALDVSLRPAPPVAGVTVEVLHNTCMWNEGFEHASAAYFQVVLASMKQAQALVAWSRGPAQPLSPGDYLDFELRVGPAFAHTPVLGLEEARRRVELVAARFEGI